MFPHYLLNKIVRPISYVFCNLVILTGIFFLSGVPVYGANLPDTVIQPLQKTTFTSAQPIQVEARIGDSTGIISSRCYFRFQETATFVFIDLELSQDGIYRGMLPTPAEHVESVEYFFLAVNANSQVVRSPVYNVQKGEGEQSLEQVVSPDIISLKTDLLEIPISLDGQFLNPDLIRIESVGQNQRFGLVGGVYRAEELPNSKVTEGYFGGFVLGMDGKLSPAKGIVSNPQVQINAGAMTNQLSENVVLTPQSQVVNDVVGPDIKGDDWSGYAYVNDSTGNSYWLVPITAIIIQNGNNVSITLTYHDTNWLGIGNYFEGTIYSDGDMSVYDQSYQTWTTYYGPVTTTSVTIADFTEVYDLETNPYPDLYVVELTRDPAPEPPVFLPGIFRLLLK